jgi:hypothetical protein
MNSLLEGLTGRCLAFYFLKKIVTFDIVQILVDFLIAFDGIRPLVSCCRQQIKIPISMNLVFPKLHVPMLLKTAGVAYREISFGPKCSSNMTSVTILSIDLEGEGLCIIHPRLSRYASGNPPRAAK